MCRNVFANKLVKHFDKVENEDKQQTKKAQIKWRRENKSRVKYTQKIKQAGTCQSKYAPLTRAFQGSQFKLSTRLRQDRLFCYQSV